MAFEINVNGMSIKVDTMAEFQAALTALGPTKNDTALPSVREEAVPEKTVPVSQMSLPPERLYRRAGEVLAPKPATAQPTHKSVGKSRGRRSFRSSYTVHDLVLDVLSKYQDKVMTAENIKRRIEREMQEFYVGEIQLGSINSVLSAGVQNGTFKRVTKGFYQINQ